MARTPFGRGRDAEGPQAGATSGSKKTPSVGAGGLTAFIDQGSEFEGKLSFRDTVRIDGRFRGEITSENTLIVGESGEVQAEIHSKTVSISGTVVGNVTASQKVVLHKTAEVTGNLQTPCLVIEEGATINGEIKMAGPAGKPALKAVGHTPVDPSAK